MLDLAPGWQAIAFVLLSFAFIGVYVKFFRGKEGPGEQPLLNRRGEQLVGQVFHLESAIVDGRGRLKIGDAFWTAEGPDLPAAAGGEAAEQGVIQAQDKGAVDRIKGLHCGLPADFASAGAASKAGAFWARRRTVPGAAQAGPF